MTASQRDEEAMIFAILTNCLCQQINMLEGAYQKNAKRLVNDLLSHSKKTLAELQKDWPEDAKESLDTMYDFFYMVVRHASETNLEDKDEFIQMVKDFAESRKKELA